MDVVQLIASGKDDKALRHMYQSYFPKIKQMVDRLGGRKEDAKDIFQDGVMILYRKIKLEGAYYENPEAFFYTLCRNLWLNKLKRENRMIHPTSFPEREDVEADIAQQLLAKEHTEKMEQLFDKLGERCSELLKMIFIEQLTTEEIAQRLMLASPDVVKTTKNRCKNKLVELLDNQPSLLKLLGRKK